MLNQVIKYTNEVFKNETVNVDYLIDRTEITINPRFRTTGADAFYCGRTRKGIIRYNPRFLEVANDEVVKQIAIHEACHIVDMYLRSIDKVWKKQDLEYEKTKGHGRNWLYLMELHGYKNAKHSHDVLAIYLIDYVLHVCECGYKDILTTHLANRIKNGSSKKYCSSCKKRAKVKNFQRINRLDRS